MRTLIKRSSFFSTSPVRYMFIGGTNFGYWNGEYCVCPELTHPAAKKLHQQPAGLPQLLRCQHAVRRSAHELRLRCPPLRGRRPHREVLCYSKRYQEGEKTESAVQFFEEEKKSVIDQFPHKSTTGYQKGRCLHPHQNTAMGVLQWRGYTNIYHTHFELFNLLLLFWLIRFTPSPQLQTVADALDELSYSGPVKSTYPQTFIELGQVLYSQECLQLSFVGFFFSMWFSVCRRLGLCCTGPPCRQTAAPRLRCHPLWTASTIEPTCPLTEWVRRTTGFLASECSLVFNLTAMVVDQA